MGFYLNKFYYFKRITMDPENEVKIDKDDQNAVRIALDDAAKQVVLELGYKENFKLIDMRLAICTVAVLIAGAAILYDWLNPFPASKFFLLVCVFSYGFLMLVLTYYMQYIEKTTFLLAHQEDPVGTEPDVVWKLSSIAKKYDEFYELNVERNDGNGNVSHDSVKKSVGEFFDTNGVLSMNAFKPVVLDLETGNSKKKTQ